VTVHELTEGRRYPATPEGPKSSHEVVCRCRRVFVEHSWDQALDAYLDHHSEEAILEEDTARIASLATRIAEAAGLGT
jgi:hypothetical protein